MNPRVRRTAGACALLLLAVPVAAFAAIDAVSAVNALRARGCGSGAAPAVAREAALDAAAKRVADGQSLRAAIEASGYRAVRSALVRTQGATTEAQLAPLLEQHCSDLAHASLRHAGVFERGTSLWIVLAEPYAVPKLDRDAVRTRILALVNRARSQPRRCGARQFAAAPPVRWSTTLEQAAAAHARDMAAHSRMSHTGSDDSSTEQRVARVRYAWTAIGENVAGGQRDADEVMRHWLASPGHCANVMDGGFTEMAVAFATNPRSELGIYWTQVFATPEPARKRN